MCLVGYILFPIDYQLYKEGVMCDPQPNYGAYHTGYLSSVEACYQTCTNGTLFHIHIQGRAGSNCQAEGCYCKCYTKKDDVGGCYTKSMPMIDLYEIRKPGKLCTALISKINTPEIYWKLIIAFTMRIYQTSTTYVWQT